MVAEQTVAGPKVLKEWIQDWIIDSGTTLPITGDISRVEEFSEKRVYVKGAPEEVVPLCEETLNQQVHPVKFSTEDRLTVL